MKRTDNLMGMHITVEVVDSQLEEKDIDGVFKYLKYVDATESNKDRFFSRICMIMID